MGRSRAVHLAVLLAVVPACALAQTVRAPAYVYSGSNPSGACAGHRVWFNTTTGAQYCCSGTTWASCGASGGGAPTGAYYVTTQADGTLSNEQVVPTCTGTQKLTFNGTMLSCAVDQDSGYSSGTAGQIQVSNGSGGFSGYGSTGCIGDNWVKGLDLNGAANCLPVGNTSGNSATATALAANPTNCAAGEAAAGIAASGAAEGCFGVLSNPSSANIVLNPTGTASAGTPGYPSYVTRYDGSGWDGGAAQPIRWSIYSDPVNASNYRLRFYDQVTARTVLSLDHAGAVAAPLGFVGALTGNASTATALATNPADCTLPQVVTGMAADGTLTCAQPTNVTGSSYTATLLASAPSTCLAGNAPQGVNQYGDATSCTLYVQPVHSGNLRLTATGTATSGAPGWDSYYFRQTGSGWDGGAAQDVFGGWYLDTFSASSYVYRMEINGPVIGYRTPLSVDQAGVITAPYGITGTASAATALAADPTDCTGNNFALGVNASGTAACAQPSFNNLSGSASIGQGGTTETASTEDAVLVGASTTDWVATVLPSCSNATTSKLLYDNTTNAFSCGTDQTGAGSGTTLRVTGSDYTNSTTTPSNIFTTSVANATEYGFECVFTNQGTATGGIRFNVNGPSASNVSFETRRYTTTSAQTLLVLQTFSGSAQTASCTSSCNTTNLNTRIAGTFTTTASGTLAFMAASSTAGQTVTVRRGSYCRIF